MLKSLSLTVDANGDVLVAGAFEGSIEFGGQTLTGVGSGPHHFLAKLSGLGKLLWFNSIEAVEPSLCSAAAGRAEPAEPSAQALGSSVVASPAVDGAFTWMQDSRARAAAPARIECPGAQQEAARPSSPGTPIHVAPPLPALPVEAPSVAEPDAHAEPERDSFEPVWVADGSTDGLAPLAPSPAWRTRLGHAFGYSLGIAGAASAVGVLALALMQQPELGPTASVFSPQGERSLAAGRFAADVAPSAAPAGERAAADATESSAATPVYGPTQADAAPKPSGLAVPAADVPHGSPAQLRTRTVELLSRGRYELALGWARALVAADPHHALSYLCLGAALLDLGRAADAQRAFDECVRRATRGDVSECVALGGHP